MKAICTCLLATLALSSFSQNFDLTIREVFDFQPGDVFEYNHSEYRTWTIPNTEERWNSRTTYLTRDTSSTGDSLIYTYESYSLQGRDTLTLTLTNLDSGLFFYNPSIHPDSLQKYRLMDSNDLRYAFDSVHYPVFFGRVSEGVNIIDLEHLSYFWAEGLGIVKRSQGNSDEGSGMTLTYYKKGLDTFGISVAVGVQEVVEKTPGISVYPNPFMDQLFIEAETDCRKCTYSLFGITGQLHQRGTLGAPINTQALPRGLYVLQVLDATGRPLLHQKLVHQ